MKYLYQEIHRLAHVWLLWCRCSFDLYLNTFSYLKDDVLVSELHWAFKFAGFPTRYIILLHSAGCTSLQQQVPSLLPTAEFLLFPYSQWRVRVLLFTELLIRDSLPFLDDLLLWKLWKEKAATDYECRAVFLNAWMHMQCWINKLISHVFTDCGKLSPWCYLYGRYGFY